MSGTVLPKATWKPMSSSTGCGSRPTDAANDAEEGTAKRVGYNDPYTAPIALGDRARGGVLDHLTDAEILEEIARVRLAHAHEPTGVPSRSDHRPPIGGRATRVP